MDEIVPKMSTIPALRSCLPRTRSRVHSREGSELRNLKFHCVLSAKPPALNNGFGWEMLEKFF